MSARYMPGVNRRNFHVPTYLFDVVLDQILPKLAPGRSSYSSSGSRVTAYERYV